MPPLVTIELTKLLPLFATLALLITAVDRPVIVSLLTRPVAVNDAGDMVVVPLYSPVTVIPNGAALMIAVIPVG